MIPRNKEREREKARRRMALLRVKRLAEISLYLRPRYFHNYFSSMAEASAANNSPDLSYLDGEGDEHLKDIPALEIWRQTFKRNVKTSIVRSKYKYVVQIISAASFSPG